MATRNRRKLAVLNKENCKEHPRSILAQNSNAPRWQEDYITQVSEEIVRRVTKRLSKGFSGTENRILGALARLDAFLMNPIIQGHAGITPEMSRNAFSTNQGTNEDGSQSDPHPEAGIFGNQTMQNSGPDDDHYMVTGVTEDLRNRTDMVTGVRGEIRQYPDMVTGVIEETENDHYMVTGATQRQDMVTGVQRETLCDHDMMTEATEQIRSQLDMVTGVQRERECVFGHDMVTGVHEENTYCSPSISSGNERKNRSTSRPQFRSESTPATIEADQILLALQQLANDNNSANFHNNNNRISKLPKSLTTTMPTFDGKSQKFELSEDLFQTGFKTHNQMSEEDKINYFHSLMRGEMHYRHLKTLMALPRRVWEKFWQFFEGNL